MLMALINAIYLVQQNEVLEEAQHWGGLMIQEDGEKSWDFWIF